jgi:hypothetical protein
VRGEQASPADSAEAPRIQPEPSANAESAPVTPASDHADHDPQ